jgi:hypothetical protein
MPSKGFLVPHLVPIAMIGCGGAGMHQPDSASALPIDAARPVDTGAADAPVYACEAASNLVCLANCTEDYPFQQEAACQGGQWSCPSGYLDSMTCPADACAVTLSQCCDLVTGDLTANPCPPEGGLRPSCPEGKIRSYELRCIPQALGVVDCGEIDGQPCSGEAHSCRSSSRMGEAWCTCLAPTAPDAGDSTWRCSYFILGFLDRESFVPPTGRAVAESVIPVRG